jgi:hypothetical protein
MQKTVIKKHWFLLFCNSFCIFIFEKWCEYSFKKSSAKKIVLKNYFLLSSWKSSADKIVLKNYFFVGILKINDENRKILIPDPDPLVRSMDPLIRIWIPYHNR